MKSTLHPFHSDDPQLEAIHDKVIEGAVLDLRDVTTLHASKDILAIGWLANTVREQMHGNVTNAVVNTVSTAAEEVASAGEIVILERGIDAVLRSVEKHRQKHADAKISAFTVEELAAGENPDHAAQRLRQAGVTSLLGAGVEVFLPSVKQRIWGASMSWKQRAAAREAALSAGIRVPAYMVQKRQPGEEQAQEVLSFRSFKCDSFASFSFEPDAATSASLAATTGMQEMKQIAIARLALPNVRHIRVYWHMLGGKLAQIALRFGASEVDGTALDPNVNPEFRRREVSREISAAGREPKEIPPVRRVVMEC